MPLLTNYWAGRIYLGFGFMIDIDRLPRMSWLHDFYDFCKFSNYFETVFKVIEYDADIWLLTARFVLFSRMFNKWIESMWLFPQICTQFDQYVQCTMFCFV